MTFSKILQKMDHFLEIKLQKKKTMFSNGPSIFNVFNVQKNNNV